jgi:transposase
VLVYPSGVDVSTSTLRYLSACVRTRRRAAGTQRPDALYADRGYDYDKYRKQVREAGIKPVIPRRGEQHDSGLGVYRWVVEQGFALLHWFRRLRIRSKSATTSTKPSSASPAPSSAGDASTTSQTVRSSKGRSATMQKSHIWRPAIFIRLQAEAEQSGGSARAYLADLSPHQRPSHPGRPRHDSEPGLHIYPGHRVPGTCASAALRTWTGGRAGSTSWPS